MTVCVPTFDGGTYIDATMTSIAAQDLDGVEVLVIDDASSDGTVEVVESYRDRLADLTLIRNPARLGAVANLNQCVNRARGTWIKPVFQDDLLDEGCLTTLRDARLPGVPAVICGRRYHYEGPLEPWRRDACEYLLEQSLGERFASGFVSGPEVTDVLVELAARGLAHLNFVGEPVAMLLDRRFVTAAGGFDTGFVQLWDYELVLRLAVTHGLVVVGEPLATFRVHGGSETSRNFASGRTRTTVVDPLRLLVAYATADSYAPARAVGWQHEPPVDLVQLAMTAATQAGEALRSSTAGPEDAPCAELVEALKSELPMGRASAGAARPDTPGPARRGMALVRRGLRGGEWWAHMIGPILTFAYLQLGWRRVPPGAGFTHLAALVASATALAAYGYAVNDTCDVVSDAAAGKANPLARIPRPDRVGLVVVLAGLGAVPWLWVHLEPTAKLLLAGIYLLPLLYSAPPARLKEHPWLGPLADAANAFVFPALFTVTLFAPLGTPAGSETLMAVSAGVWSLGYGLRSILIHQLGDLEADTRSGTQTAVTKIGADRVSRIIRVGVFPTELVGLLLLAATTLTWSPGAVLAGIAYAAVFQAARRSGVVVAPIAAVPTRGGYVSLMAWYEVWPPLILGSALVIGEPWYLIPFAIHLMLFHRSVRSQMHDFEHLVVETFRRLR